MAPPTLETLQAMATAANSLASDGESFHRDEMCSDAAYLAREMKLGPKHRVLDDGPYNVKLSFPACVAIGTAAFTVTSGGATHAKRVLRVIKDKNAAVDDTTIVHPRGNAVRKGVTPWKDLLDTGRLPPWPSHQQLHDQYVKRVEQHNDLSWSILMPIKLYVTLQGFSNDEVNLYIPPLGRAVRDGITNLMGASFRESAKGYRDAYAMHLHLARLAQSNVMVINSGFWVAGR